MYFVSHSCPWQLDQMRIVAWPWHFLQMNGSSYKQKKRKEKLQRQAFFATKNEKRNLGDVGGLTTRYYWNGISDVGDEI
jgi:hypothetical protein